MNERMAKSERLAGLGRMAAGVAHEIRNPLAAARLQGENALAGDDGRRRTAIGEMLLQLDRLDALVSELLAMTQRADPAPAACQLGSFLDEVVSRHRQEASARRIEIELGKTDEIALIDATMIGRVMDNLLSNAVRHTPDGGTVMVRTDRTPGLLTISVEDTGYGVRADMAERLFEPFATGRPDGTGLGLAIARELADAHGGRLRLQQTRCDDANKGAVFVLELPQEDT